MTGIFLQQIVYLGGMSLLVLLSTACQDRCDPDTDHLKCKDNTLYYCHDNPADAGSKWIEVMNCSTYNAVCTQEDVPIPIEISDAAPFQLDPQTHGCALQENICDGDTNLHCNDEHSAIAVCTYASDEPAALVIKENKNDYPQCIETADGLAAFGYIDGECVDGSTICHGNFDMYVCEFSVWSHLSTDVCDVKEHQVCTARTDTDGNPSASCDFADPCNEETGDYEICAPELSEDAMFHCNFSTTFNMWKWDPYFCPTGTVCASAGSSVANCETK